MKLPTLYHTNAKGTVYEWTVFTVGPDIVTIYGQVGGEMQQATKTAVGKNIGRANETTAEEQADAEARSMWTKKKDKKYTEVQGEVHVFEAPMLADGWEKHGAKITFPCYAQPKLDGLRALLRHNGTTFELWSRGGKLIETCDHIIQAANLHLHSDTIYDGELYAHGLTFEENTRLVKKWRPETADLIKFHIFDIADTTKTFEERDVELACTFFSVSMKGLDAEPTITNLLPACFEKVDTWIAGNQDRLDDVHAYFMQEGYEGSIVRSAKGRYVFGKRSKDVLKRKDFQDAEFEIVSYTNGVGKFLTCPIYTCKTASGSLFQVAPRGSADQRAEMLREADSHIGKLLNVRFQNYTDYGIPRFPVGTTIRESWDNS